MNKDKIAIGCDHGGYDLKVGILNYLKKRGVEVDDMGTHTTESVDYPDFGHEVARRIASGENSRAILICGTGIGMTITANRYKGVRAALCNDIYTSRMSRLHNDANVLVIGGRVVGPAIAEEIVSTWLETDFEGGRHSRRIDKIEESPSKLFIEKLLKNGKEKK